MEKQESNGANKWRYNKDNVKPTARFELFLFLIHKYSNNIINTIITKIGYFSWMWSRLTSRAGNNVKERNRNTIWSNIDLYGKYITRIAFPALLTPIVHLLQETDFYEVR
jgi:hypothetical protein